MRTTKNIDVLRIIVGERFGQTLITVEFPLSWGGGEKRVKLPGKPFASEENSKISCCISNDATDDDERNTRDKKGTTSKQL